MVSINDASNSLYLNLFDEALQTPNQTKLWFTVLLSCLEGLNFFWREIVSILPCFTLLTLESLADISFLTTAKKLDKFYKVGVYTIILVLFSVKTTSDLKSKALGNIIYLMTSSLLFLSISYNTHY